MNEFLDALFLTCFYCYISYTLSTCSICKVCIMHWIFMTLSWLYKFLICWPALCKGSYTVLTIDFLLVELWVTHPLILYSPWSTHRTPSRAYPTPYHTSPSEKCHPKMSMWFTMIACFCMIKTLESAWFVVKQWSLYNSICLL